MCKLRIGNGYDVHRLAEGYALWVGGVQIPHTKGSVGHSDGDVLIHAICDAMLGALALGDIGAHFPDTDPSLKGVDSKLLLAKTIELVRSKGYELVNIDSTVCLQQPKLRPHIDSMRCVLADTIKVDKSCISVKATTSEQLGFEGREEGVSAYAIVLLSCQ